MNTDRRELGSFSDFDVEHKKLERTQELVRIGAASREELERVEADSAKWGHQTVTVADGILDRLVHNAHRIEMRGDSMRNNRGKANA